MQQDFNAFLQGFSEKFPIEQESSVKNCMSYTIFYILKIGSGLGSRFGQARIHSTGSNKGSNFLKKTPKLL